MNEIDDLILELLTNLKRFMKVCFFKEIHYSEIIVKFLKNFPFSMNFEKR